MSLREPTFDQIFIWGLSLWVVGFMFLLISIREQRPRPWLSVLGVVFMILSFGVFAGGISSEFLRIP